MRIGIDFDNTIANYEGVFHAAALEQGLIPADLSRSKNAVRDHLNGLGQSDAFTRLQGHVYGTRMDLARVYEGFDEFIRLARDAGHELSIVSHKTRTPLLGPAHDLHEAARRFLIERGLVGTGAIALDRVFFEERKEEKVARIAALGCDVFIDDLPEILLMAGFPETVRAVLFDPERHHGARDLPSRITRLGSWRDIMAVLLGIAR